MPRRARPSTVFPVSLREVEVARVQDVTPGMRRVTLTGPQLCAFTSRNGLPQPPFNSTGFDDDIRLFFAHPGDTGPVLPEQGDGTLIWPKKPRPLYRAYSVRRWDAVACELDVDFVGHGVGVAAAWAYSAQPGDRVHFMGPHSSEGVPQNVDWWLVAGDETALPAIGRLLEELPEDARGQVFIEVVEKGHIQQLRELPGVAVAWLVSGGAETGTTTPLVDAVRAAPWWEGQPFAWIAGEQTAVRDLRRHLIEERGLSRADIDFAGYWKRTEAAAAMSDATSFDPDASTDAIDRFHDLADLIPPIAIRTAVELGLGDLISRGVTAVAELAERTGSDERALGKLLRYLHSIDVLTQIEPGHYRLTEVGEYLADDYWIEALNPVGVAGRLAAGIFGLTASVRTGGPSYASVTGREFAELRAEQLFADQFFDDGANDAEYLAEPLASSGVLDGAEHLVIRSEGAGVEAREITAACPALRVTISAPPAQANWLRRDLPSTIPDPAQLARVEIVEQSLLEPPPPADAVLLVHALGSLNDTDAGAALRAAASGVRDGGRVLLIEPVFDTDQLDEHDGEDDLLALTRDGTGLRTEDELLLAIQHAGLRLAASRTIGWGTTLRELTPAH